MIILKLVDVFQCNRENSFYYIFPPPLFDKGAFGLLALNPGLIGAYNILRLQYCCNRHLGNGVWWKKAKVSALVLRTYVAKRRP